MAFGIYVTPCEVIGLGESQEFFSLSSIWLISDNENGTWTWVGPSGPPTSQGKHMLGT